MPSTSISRNMGVGPSAVTLRLKAEKGRLKACTVTQIEGLSDPGALYVSVGIALAPGTPATIVAFLYSGSFTEYEPIGWTGDIPLGPQYEVYARFRTIGQATCKLAIVTE